MGNGLRWSTKLNCVCSRLTVERDGVISELEAALKKQMDDLIAMREALNVNKKRLEASEAERIKVGIWMNTLYYQRYSNFVFYYRMNNLILLSHVIHFNIYFTAPRRFQCPQCRIREIQGWAATIDQVLCSFFLESSEYININIQNRTWKAIWGDSVQTYWSTIQDREIWGLQC